MRQVMMLLGCAVLLTCRDEQAGPKVKAPRPVGVQALQQLPAMQQPSGATWAQGAVVYHGSNISPERPRPGQPVTVTHYFSATREVPRGMMFFSHLVDANSLEMVANLDHEIQQGAAPLGTWPVNAIIEDVSTFQMPEGTGDLRVMIGFWNQQGRLNADVVALTDGTGRIKGPVIAGTQAPLPEYRVGRVSQPLVIDGRLSDPAWAKAPEATLVTSFDGQKTRVHTTFRMLYDDEYLYVGWQMEDSDVWGTLRKKDDPIYNEECVEVFIDADGDGKTYNELQVSPHNVNFDASFVARRSDLPTAMSWESGMLTAVQVQGTLDDDKTDTGWSAEMKIPLKNLTAVPRLPPQPGDVWRFNAYRLEHFVHGRDIEGQAFSPLGVGDFHHLPRFGRLVFQ